jgi:hypothetical protein
MKTTALLGLFLVLFAPAALAREGKRKTILDYYLSTEIDALLPTRPESQKERLADIEKRDVPRGYLRFRVGLAEGAEMKLFRMPDGTPLVAVAHTGCCCEGTCVRTIHFLADRGGELVDVTAGVWSDPSLDDKRKAIEKRTKPSERWMAGRMADMAEYRLPISTAAVFIQEGNQTYLRFRLKGDKFVRY